MTPHSAQDGSSLDTGRKSTEDEAVGQNWYRSRSYDPDSGRLYSRYVVKKVPSILNL